MTKELMISLPGGYESGTRRYPLLLSLDPGLPVGKIASAFMTEGVLPPMIVAARTEGSSSQASELIGHLVSSYRILESPEAHWLCGTGHSAAEALRTVLHHPNLSSQAVCLSTSFEGLEGAPPLHSRLLGELEELKSLPPGLRLYLDYGSVGLDECYEPYHRDAGALLRAGGWKDGREFQIRRIVDGRHDTDSWADRLGPGLRWLAGH